MTQAELDILVEAAISNHLLKDYWNALADRAKSAALYMAAGDCLTYIGWSLDTLATDTPMLGTLCDAIAEQAIFLTRHYEDGESGRIVASESAGGVSQSFAIAKGVADGGIWSTRAKALLDTIRKRCAGSLRIARG